MVETSDYSISRETERGSKVGVGRTETRRFGGNREGRWTGNEKEKVYGPYKSGGSGEIPEEKKVKSPLKRDY